MPGTFNIADSLLEADTQRALAVSPRAKLHGAMIGIINLIPSAFLESTLREDASGHYLTLFLFTHSIVFLLFILTHLLTSGKEILHKAKIFPTTSSARILYGVTSSLRQPIVNALLASNVLFFAILYRSDFSISVAAIGFYVVLMLDICVVASVAFLLLDFRNTSPSIIIVIVVLVSLGGVVASLVFQSDTALMSMPVFSSAAEGIVELKNGIQSNTIRHILVLLGIPIATLLVARKFA